MHVDLTPHLLGYGSYTVQVEAHGPRGQTCKAQTREISYTGLGIGARTLEGEVSRSGLYSFCVCRMHMVERHECIPDMQLDLLSTLPLTCSLQ
jgi:hypothetical protein